MSQNLLSCPLDGVCTCCGILYWVFVLPLLWDKVLKMKLKFKLKIGIEIEIEIEIEFEIEIEIEIETWNWNWNRNWNWNLKLKLKFLHWVFFLVWPDSRNVAGTIASLCKFKWVYLVVFQDFWMIFLIRGVPWRFLFSLPNEGL